MKGTIMAYVKKAKKVKKVKKAPARTRAHKDDGTFIADDPSTPDVNEAYEVAVPVDVGSVREAQRSKPGGTRSSQRRLKGKLVM